MNRALEPGELLSGAPTTWSAGTLEDARCGGAVPAGWSCIPPTGPEGFLMGSALDDPNGWDLEQPQHRVVLTRPYLISRTEVTQDEWEALIGDNPSHFSGCGGDCPVDSTGWFGAVEYCNRLSREEGLEECYAIDGDDVTWPRGLDCAGYRLPTEAEWEHAARAGTTTDFVLGPILHSGENCDHEPNLDPVGWYCGNAVVEYQPCHDHARQPGCVGTHPVASKRPNAWGLYDMHGNMEEWVWDRWAFHTEDDQVDPLGPDAGAERVQKGGVVSEAAFKSRSAWRTRSTPDTINWTGFRVARSPCVSERCNGRDDDCDGEVDDGLPWCGAEPPRHRDVVLSDDAEPDHAGTSARRRTGELIEVPLVAGGYLDESVVAYWRLDGDGTEWVSGAAPAHASGVAAPDRNGAPGRALGLDGVAHVDTGFQPEIAATDSLSIFAWARIDGLSDPEDPGFVLGYDDNPPRSQLLLGCSFADHPMLQVRGEQNDGVTVAAPGQGLRCLDGEWHHYGLVRDSGGDRLLLFFDGALVGSAEDTTDSRLNAAGESLFLGARSLFGAVADPIVGAVDEVVMLSRALSPLEVHHYYESGADWGTPLLPGAQPDFDDLLVTEDGTPVEFELVGARPLADRAADLDGHVIGYWPLDGTVEDLTGRSQSVNHGAVPTGGRCGDPAGAMILDGEDAIDAGLELALGPLDDVTVELWARRLERDGQHTMVSIDNDDAGRLVFGCNDHASWYQFMAGESRGGVGVAPSVCSDAGWHHFALVRDTGAGRIRFYEDGLPVRNDVGVGAIFDAGGLHLHLGARQFGDAYYEPWMGELDDVVVHDVARSADYLYKRAHPLPRVRFLADTDADTDGLDRFPYRAYRLAWGVPDVPAPPSRVDDLLGPRNGILAWWRFEEGLGAGKVVDWSVQRMHGTVHGGVQHAPGSVGAAVELDRGHVDVDPGGALDGLSELTVELVVKAEGGGGRQTVLSRRYTGDPGTGGLHAQWASRDAPPPRPFYCRVGRPDNVLGQSNLALNQWHHLACTGGGGWLRAWVDGQQDAATEQAQALDLGTGDIVLGRWLDADVHWFDGAIDEVRFSGRVLASHELLPTVATTGSLGPLHDARCGGPVPAGWSCIPATGPDGFLRGSPEDEPGRIPDQEATPHTVVLTRPFLMKQTEVTADERQAGGAEPAAGWGTGPPAVSLSWLDAVTYANARSRAETLDECYVINGGTVTWPDGPACTGYRLPTDAEWEYAARAGTRTAYYTGVVVDGTNDCHNEPALDPAGWYCDNSGGAVHPVAQKVPNAWGLFDMHGNVGEWVWDHDGAQEADAEDPTGPEEGPYRVIRSGAYTYTPTNCRSAYRTWTRQNDHAPDRGFRLVRTAVAP